jgi:hypothetical protein
MEVQRSSHSCEDAIVLVNDTSLPFTAPVKGPEPLRPSDHMTCPAIAPLLLSVTFVRVSRPSALSVVLHPTPLYELTRCVVSLESCASGDELVPIVLPALDVVVAVSLGCDGDGAVPADEVVAVDGVAGGWRDDPPLVAEKVAAAMITAPTTAPINPLNN